MIRRIASLAARLDDSWAGDLIGAICVAAIGYGAFFIAGVLE